MPVITLLFVFIAGFVLGIAAALILRMVQTKNTKELAEELFAAILDDLDHGVTKTEISSCFHHSVAHMVIRMCQILARDTGINNVALSGGVFQNRLLLRLISGYLEKTGLNVITHREVPTNDGGISLGQAVIGNFIT